MKILTASELIKSTSILQPAIQKRIKNLNYGGCGLFAYLYYKRVKPLYPRLKISIVDQNIPIINIKSVAREIVKNNNSLPLDMDDTDYTVQKLACSHVMIRIGNHHIDGYNTIDHEV